MTAIAVVPWIALVLAGIYAMQWGAGRACGLLGHLRARFGLSAAAGGALMGVATATPEISVNVASVAFGWPDLGLGAALGSNVPALPLVFVLSYLSTRMAARNPAGPAEPPPRVQPEAVPVQVVPYALVLLLLAALTLPSQLAGLQPVDGIILLCAFAGYFAWTVLSEARGEGTPMPPGAWTRALLALPVIALGAVASVYGARKVGDAFGFSQLVTGLFVIGFLCALPESYAAWGLARKRKATTAVSGAMGDGIVSLTLALIPPAIVGAVVGNVTIYILNLAFIGVVLLAYIAFNRRGRGQELGLGRVSFYGAGYGTYLVATVLVLSR
jgi:cation:H+ antiporter